MSTEVDISDISVQATRVVRQYSYGQLDDILETEQGVEGFFDYHDEWEDDDIEDFEYRVEVEGVVPMDRHKQFIDNLQKRIDRLEATIEKMKNKKGEEE